MLKHPQVQRDTNHICLELILLINQFLKLHQITLMRKNPCLYQQGLAKCGMFIAIIQQCPPRCTNNNDKCSGRAALSVLSHQANNVFGLKLNGDVLGKQ